MMLDSESTSLSSSDVVSVNYTDLYSTLCRSLNSEQTTLLLYMFLHRVDAVRAFILSRANIDHLVRMSTIYTALQSVHIVYCLLCGSYSETSNVVCSLLTVGN